MADRNPFGRVACPVAAVAAVAAATTSGGLVDRPGISWRAAAFLVNGQEASGPRQRLPLIVLCDRLADLHRGASSHANRGASQAPSKWPLCMERMGRYVLKFEGLASAKSSEVIDWLAPVLQGYLTGKLD